MNYFNLHTHQYTKKRNVLELVNQYPQKFDADIPFYSIGIHPWYINWERVDFDLEIIDQKLQQVNCLALGECGLDKRIDVPLAQQKIVFEKQLLLAEKHKKPLIIHCVAAFDELMACTKKLKISVPVVVHGFSKNEAVAKQLLKQGFYLSFGKYLFQNPDLESVFRAVPNSHFFLETDTMTQTLEEVYLLAAQFKRKTLGAIQEQIGENFLAVFGNKII